MNFFPNEPNYNNYLYRYIPSLNPREKTGKSEKRYVNEIRNCGRNLHKIS